MRARVYSPDLGRFLSPDPVGHADSSNLYAFVDSAPLKWVDPFGISRARPLSQRGQLAIGRMLLEARTLHHDGFYFDPWEVSAAFDQFLRSPGDAVGDLFRYGRTGLGWFDKEVCDAGCMMSMPGLNLLATGRAALVVASSKATQGFSRFQRFFAPLAVAAGGEVSVGQAVYRVSGGAAARAAAGRTVLGHAGYVEEAQKLGANYFEIADDVWAKMDDAERWAANEKFLDDVIARGDDIILSTPAGKAFPNSFFDRELKYLAGQGFAPNADGTRMLQKP
jgi:hypothetical protein